ncbi:hypothetical protein TKK_0009388 [Trichogramma kaykai]|uniref:Rho-GAP domain-containing protein n=1 Tax=Trichogramma kaykai TaxID=54128 RepID=A0ABD2WZY8_9HYME
MRGPQPEPFYQQAQLQLDRTKVTVTQPLPTSCSSTSSSSSSVGPASSSALIQQQQSQRPSHQRRYQQQQQQQQQPTGKEHESRLAKVKRVLLGRIVANHGAGNNAGFGIDLDCVKLHNETGVPKLVQRLCSFCESRAFENPGLFEAAAIGAASSANRKLAERLRQSFERRGDADLESAAAGCPAVAPILLRQYLEELPRPLLGSSCLYKICQLHAHERCNDQQRWAADTRRLLSDELAPRNQRLFSYLLLFFSRYEQLHGPSRAIPATFGPLLLPGLATSAPLLRDILQDARSIIAAQYSGLNKNSMSNVLDVCTKSKAKCNLYENSPMNSSASLGANKPSKRKDRSDSCGQERKLIRSNSEEKIWDNVKVSKTEENDNRNESTEKAIRRVSSHEDFNKSKHLLLLSKLQKDMGHGPRHNSLPLQEKTNSSPVSSRQSLIYSSGEVVLATEKYDCDAERLRSSERFSRSIIPKGRRQVRRLKLHRTSLSEEASSKENESNRPEVIYTIGGDSIRNGQQGQSFLEMLSSGPSRSPSPVRPPSSTPDDANHPTLANWGFHMRQNNDEETGERIEDMVSPRNSILVPRRFYSEEYSNDQENATSVKDFSLKTLAKQISSLKKRIKRYESEFEDNFGYRPSHSDKMSNRDIKRLVTELNKVRKEHKILKEGVFGSLLGSRFNREEHNNNNNIIGNEIEEKLRASSMNEMVMDVERKLSDKRIKSSRSDNMEELSYEQLMEEKTAVQKALLHIENIFGRPVSKEDRTIVRPLYDKYRTLKRLLIRAGANQYTDSMSELETILEHETMDFSSTSGNPIDCERRASEPDMSHRGILDCIDSSSEQITDSDSQHSSSESSRGIIESLHSMSKDDLLLQQRITKEEKKRLRRALKELEMQFEARAGRRMQRADRGPEVSMIYESYKETKAKLRLVSALLAKNP